MLSTLQQQILNKFVDKYESKSTYGINDTSKRRVFLYVKDFPDYFHASDSQYRKDLNAETLDLEKKGFINIHWEQHNRGEYLEKLSLVEESLQQIYNLLKRIPRKEKYRKILEICNNYLFEAPNSLQMFFEEMLAKICSFQSLPSVFNLESEIQTKEALSGLIHLVSNNMEVTKRKWSILLYNDSKKWDEYEKRILSVIKDYVQLEYKDWDDRHILSEYGIIENPQMVIVSGHMVLETSKGTINFSSDDFGLGIHPSTLKEAKIISMAADAVITIENKTSYYDYVEYVKEKQQNEIIIYLGGYHNYERRLILKLIDDYVKSNGLPVQFKHWGDIDLGGFQIWNHLCQKTNIPFEPILMNTTTFKSYQDMGKEITDKSYVSKLASLLNKPQYSVFYDVISFMIDNKKRVEQEVIQIS